jgi:hypothetical protein
MELSITGESLPRQRPKVCSPVAFYKRTLTERIQALLILLLNLGYQMTFGRFCCGIPFFQQLDSDFQLMVGRT